MKRLFILAALLALCASVPAQLAAPGNLRNVAPTTFFYDGFNGGALSSNWYVIQRHGEYAQSENECNAASQVAAGSGGLIITTIAQATSCGDFNIDGSVRTIPQSWPYLTGDIQWSTISFTYGTVIFRAKMPPKSTNTWPAVWLLGQNCQNTNKYTGDINYSTCPALTSASYAEIDIIECEADAGSSWCHIALANDANTGSGGATFPVCPYNQNPIDNNFHTYKMVWTSTSITLSIDGVDSGCSFTSPTWTIPSTPMFMIIQTQTAPAHGTPTGLPTQLVVDYVMVTQP
jgi:beta-glucanase (GH16 family)